MAAGTTTPHYAPLCLCTCGTSFHATAEAAHVREWHGQFNPAAVRLATRAEHAAAGWDVTAYPEHIS